MIYDRTEIKHGFPTMQSNAFVVSASQKGWGVDFIVIAIDSNDAIEKVKSNCRNLIEAVKKTLKPDDLVPKPVFRDPDPSNTLKSRELREEITRMNNDLDDLGDREDELAMTRRETLTESIQKNHERIKELSEPKQVGSESRLDLMTPTPHRVLSPETQFEAQLLSGERCYAASYFDDSRSYTQYYG